MLILLLAKIDFNAPTVLGIPLGMMLIILYYLNTMKNWGGSGVQTSENTMDVKLNNELASDTVSFQRSEAQFGQGRCIVKYTVKLRKTGTYVIAGGRAESGVFSRSNYGTRTVSGDAGDVISGAISCSQFSGGVWAIGAFRSMADVPTR